MKEVRIRSSRECAYCEGIIPKGSSCYSYSNKHQGRKWVCKECVRQWRSVISARSDRGYIPYYDEGMAHVVEDNISALENRFESMKGSNKGRVIS